MIHVTEVGVYRVLFAADWPFEPSKEPVEGIENLPLSVAEKEKLFHTNARGYSAYSLIEGQRRPK
jgi:predicted TIM-barrel fold metal-dependent hydrolase